MEAAGARRRERDQAIIAVMFYMGLKPIEVFHLDVAHVRLDERLVYVARASSNPRTQPLEPEAEAYIRRWLDVRNRRVKKPTLAPATAAERQGRSRAHQPCARKELRAG